MKRLAGLLLAVWAAFLVLHWTPWLRAHGRDRDDLILGLITVVYAATVTVMLLATRSWTRRGLGLLATKTGIALLFGNALLVAVRHPVPDQPAVLDLVRALFVVGGLLVLWGLIAWWRGDDGVEAK